MTFTAADPGFTKWGSKSGVKRGAVSAQIETPKA